MRVNFLLHATPNFFFLSFCFLPHPSHSIAGHENKAFKVITLRGMGHLAFKTAGFTTARKLAFLSIGDFIAIFFKEGLMTPTSSKKFLTIKVGVEGDSGTVGSDRIPVLCSGCLCGIMFSAMPNYQFSAGPKHQSFCRLTLAHQKAKAKGQKGYGEHDAAKAAAAEEFAGRVVLQSITGEGLGIFFIPPADAFPTMDSMIGGMNGLTVSSARRYPVNSMSLLAPHAPEGNPWAPIAYQFSEHDAEKAAAAEGLGIFLIRPADAFPSMDGIFGGMNGHCGASRR
ncbi:hypothetical protein FSST1_006250 [Fusarium sambucinum]